jgi:hypothetical protein
VSVLLDAAGRRRSPATLPGYRSGCSPRNKGRRYPADPPRVEEIIAVMRAAGDGVHAERVRALVVILWRGRAADQRGAVTRGDRSGAQARIDSGPAREGR